MTRTEIINTLIERYGLHSYLEIGTDDPKQNFDLINAEIKHSVDPATHHSYTYNMTSDEFFSNHASQMYDLIFIDGLHTAEQAIKDIGNALGWLNQNGFIVIHDCNPHTEDLTVPYEQFLEHGGAWTGDVYKAFIIVKMLLPTWSAFVVDTDYGCGIITWINLLQNKRTFVSIANLTFEQFSANREALLQLISVEKFKELIAENTRKTCPHCGRAFKQPETPGSIFCCKACEYGY